MLDPSLEDANIIRDWADKFNRISRFEDALESYKDSTIIMQEILGPNHPKTLENKLKHAKCHFSAQHYDESLKIYQDMLSFENELEMLEKYNAYIGIGNVCYAQTKYSDALNYYEKALQFGLKQFSNDDSSELRILYQTLGSTARLTKEFNKSIHYHNQLKLMLILIHGSSHAEVQNVEALISNTYTIMKEGPKAIELLKDSQIKILNEHGDQNIAELALSYYNLGFASTQNKRFNEAVNYYKKAVEAYEKRDAKKHAASLQKCFNSLGTVYEIIEDMGNALIYYRSALQFPDDIKSEIDIINCCLTFAGISARTGDLEGAKKYYEKAYKIQIEKYGLKNPNVASIGVRLALISQKLGQIDEATDFIIDSVITLEQIYGKQHETSIDANKLFEEILEKKNKKH